MNFKRSQRFQKLSINWELFWIFPLGQQKGKKELCWRCRGSQFVSVVATTGSLYEFRNEQTKTRWSAHFTTKAKPQPSLAEQFYQFPGGNSIIQETFFLFRITGVPCYQLGQESSIPGPPSSAGPQRLGGAQPQPGYLSQAARQAKLCPAHLATWEKLRKCRPAT